MASQVSSQHASQEGSKHSPYFKTHISFDLAPPLLGPPYSLTHTPDIHIRHTHIYAHTQVFRMYVQGYLLPSIQYSCLENPMDRGAWWAAVHAVAKSCTRLSDFTFTFHFHALEKEMATHSSVLAWRIPGMGELGGLASMGFHRVRHE